MKIDRISEWSYYRLTSALVPEDWFKTKTDANGQFFFDNVPEDATADFGAEAPGRALMP